MTTVGQHPGYEVPQRAAGTSPAWPRLLLVALAVALAATAGYLIYDSASSEPVAEPITFEAYPSYETVQGEIDAALLAAGGVSAVEMMRAEVDEAKMWMEFGAASVPLLVTRADLLASPSSVAMVQAEIDASLAEQVRLATLTEFWDAEYVADFVAPATISLVTEATSGPAEAWEREVPVLDEPAPATTGPTEAWEREYVFGLVND